MGAKEEDFEENGMITRDAAEIIEQDVLPTIVSMENTFNKIADIHLTKAQGGSVNGASQSAQQDGQKNAKENAQILCAFKSNELALALQLASGNKAVPSTPGIGMGSSSDHRQGQ
jgi:hypothetical protein